MSHMEPIENEADLPEPDKDNTTGLPPVDPPEEENAL